MGLSEKSGSPFLNFEAMKKWKAVPKRCHNSITLMKFGTISSEYFNVIGVHKFCKFISGRIPEGFSGGRLPSLFLLISAR